ncbi:hypothetical protein [Sphingomonas bacterium]|uniref:hypothetical protein n=1 Tax=Sphingomonas bacterium TaxID=1895847 RepID=UPI001576357C|nr:hypothetical protein [Sphingomonas bacterium]
MKSGDQVDWEGITPGDYQRYIQTMMRFYPQIQFASQFSFQEIEKWAKENWSSLYDTHKGTRQISGIEVVDIPLSQIPDNALEKSFLTKLANHEFEQILKVEQGLDREQKAKNEILDSLFSEGIDQMDSRS